MKKILLAIVVVICFSGIAKAESWVLWESSGDIPTGNEVPWHIVGAYPSYNSCRQMEQSICTKYESEFSKDIKDVKCYESLGGHTVTVFYNENQRKTLKDLKDSSWGFAYEWKCLPDTVDPRK